MPSTCRKFLTSTLATLPAALGLTHRVASSADKPVRRMGLVIHSFPVHVAASKSRGDRLPFADPFRFLDHANELGAAGIQVGIGSLDATERTRLRDRLAATGMFLEGMVRLPKDRDDVARFDQELGAAKDCGVTILRTVCLNGRRYETFDSAEAFREFKQQAWQSLTLAEPVAAKHGVRLAVENHKDWRVDELLDILKRLDSRHVGVNLDTGNSIALLEDPHAVVEAFTPWAITTHFKDMAVAEYADGFLLAEVPLGRGFLDLKRIVATLRQANPAIRINLEMITRDPLKVPCLMPKFWATFDSLAARHLADALACVKRHAPDRPLPEISRLPIDRQLEIETTNVRESLKFADELLG